MFAGISVVVIQRRQRYIKTSNAVNELAPDARLKIMIAYRDFYGTADEYKYREVCRENDIDPDDYAFYRTFD